MNTRVDLKTRNLGAAAAAGSRAVTREGVAAASAITSQTGGKIGGDSV